MANIIKIKRGSSVPGTSDLANYELGYRTGTQELYINDGGTIRQVGSGSSGGGAVDSIANFADNRVLTASDADSIRGEGNLTFDGTTLAITGALTTTSTINIGGAATFQSHINMGDSDQLKLGSDADMKIQHTGSHGYITNDTGHLYIRSGADDKQINIQADDGSGGMTDYMRFSGSESLIRVYKTMRFLDSVNLQLGSGNDLQLKHDGSNSYIQNRLVGKLIISNQVDDTDIDIKVKDGGSSITALTIDASENGRVKLPRDNQKLTLGASNDINLFHDASNSYFTNATGDLYFQNTADNKDIVFQSDDNSGGVTQYLRLDGGDKRLYMFNTRMQIRDDGTLHWGSAAAHGILSWDTGRAIVTATGANNLDLKAASGYQVVVNETQSNVDFRVESDTNAHLLFADASSNRIGILSSSPNATLDVAGIGQFRGTSSEAVNLYLGQTTSNSAFMYEFSTYDAAGGIINAGDHLQIKSYRWGQDISFARNGQGGAVPTARFFSSGDTGHFQLYKATDPTNNANYETRVKLNVNGDSYLNGGNIGINTTSPGDRLHIYESGNATIRIQGAGGQANIRYQNDAQSWYAGITAAEQFYWYSSELGATTNMIHTNGDFYTYYDFLISNNNRALEGRETGGTIRSLIKLNSSNQVEVGSNPDMILKSNGAQRLKLHSDGVVRSYGNHVFGAENSNSKAYIRANNGYSGASTPDYTWWYNDTCGIFHPAANTIGFSTGSNERFRLSDDGDFKFTGTNSNFESVGGGNATYLLLSGTATQRIEFRNTSNNANGWIGIPSWNTDAWHEYMPTSSGNELAYVYESSRHNYYRGFTVNNGGDDYDFIVKGQSDDNLIRTDASNDRVGIGISAPGELLHVDGSIEFAGRKYNRGSVTVTGAGTSNGQAITLSTELGTTLHVNYQYRITLNTTGTGTDTGAVYILTYDQDNSAWKLHLVSRKGSSSNHPLAFVDGSNLKVYHNHSNAYNILYFVELWDMAADDGTLHGWGSDFMWTRDVNTLSYTDGKVEADIDLGSGSNTIKKTFATNNYPAVTVHSSGTGDSGAAIAIQQATTEGDTIIFADFEPHVEWGISAENSNNRIDFTGGSSSPSLGTRTFKNNSGSDRTAYRKMSVRLDNGNVDIAGNLTVANGSAYAGDSTSGVWSTGSWAGDLTSNGWERVAGVAHDGGEIALVEKSAQMSVLIDGSYFSYESGSNTGGGFWSSTSSNYANAPGIRASAASELYVIQADGGVSDLKVSGEIKVQNANGTMVGMKGTNFGYSTSYRVLQIGDTSGNYSIAFGYDPSGNSNSQFTGDGRELIFRNGAEFLTPNSSNDGFHNDVITLKDGTACFGHSSPWNNTKLDLGANANNHMRTGGKLYFYDSNRYIGRNGNHIEMYANTGTVKMLDALQVHNKYTTGGDQRNTYNHFSWKSGSNVAGALICNTDIPRASNRMTVLHFEGYGYGHGAVIDFKVAFYPYSGVTGQDGVDGRPLEYSIVDNGNDGLQKFIGVNSSGNIAIAIGDYNDGNKYYFHYHVNVLQGHNNSADLGSWSGTSSTTDGFGWLDKRALYSPIWNKERGDAHQDHHRLILGSGSEGHTLRTDSGYIKFGPMNSGWGHIETDRASFYFNKKLTVDEGIVQSYDEDLSLRRNQSSADRIDITDSYTRVIVNNNEEFRVDASGTLTSGQARATNEFQVNSSGTTIRRYVSSWNSGMQTHDVIYNGYGTTMGDYVYLKTSGNTATTHGMLLSSDQYLFWGRADVVTGAVTNSATAPFADVCMRVDYDGNALFDGDVTAFSGDIASDIRLKKNIKDLNYGLKDVLNIRPVSFDWKEKRNGKHDIGFIAQEIEKIIPEVVNEVDTLNGEDTHKTVDYAKLTSVLIKAVQEQQQQINELKEKLNG